MMTAVLLAKQFSAALRRTRNHASLDIVLGEIDR
jgi:hypothetical protein